MWEKFKVWFVDMTDAAFDYIFSSDEGQTRMLCLYVVMFLACLAGMVHAAYRAVSCFPGADILDGCRVRRLVRRTGCCDVCFAAGSF